MLKYAKAYNNLVEQDSLQNIKIKQQNNIIKSQDSIINSYENIIIPTFEKEIASLNYQNLQFQIELKKEKELFAIRLEREEMELQKFKSKRINIGLGGCYGFSNNGTGFNAGVVVSYTLFRF